MKWGIFLAVLALGAAVAGCGSSTPATTGPTVAASLPAPAVSGPPVTTTQAPVTATQAAESQPAGNPGSGTVTVTLTGGADAGTYTGGDNPNCSDGLLPGSWGVQYSTDAAGSGQLSSVQMIDPSAPSADNPFTLTVTIGKLFEGNDYDVGGANGGGTGSAQVTDNGSTAVIHATGTTKDGVGVDVTINCPSVLRGGG